MGGFKVGKTKSRKNTKGLLLVRLARAMVSESANGHPELTSRCQSPVCHETCTTSKSLTRYWKRLDASLPKNSGTKSLMEISSPFDLDGEWGQRAIPRFNKFTTRMQDYADYLPC